MRQHDRGIGWLRAGWNAALQAAVMALPMIVMLAWRSEAHGGATSDWFNWNGKCAVARKRASRPLESVRRGIGRWRLRWCSLEALRNPHLTFSRNLAFSGIGPDRDLHRCFRGSCSGRPMPTCGSHLICSRYSCSRSGSGAKPAAALASALAIAALLFCVVRLGGNTLSLAMASNDQQAKLQAIGYMPIGARVVTQVGMPCTNSWPLARNSHLGAMVMVRRDGFSNDQWLMEGANLLNLRYKAAGYFAADPSQIVRPNNCIGDRLHRTIDNSLGGIPRKDFDFAWLIDPPPYDPALVADLRPVWRGPGSVLYRLHP